jgi:pyruvate carboxylase subunit B
MVQLMETALRDAHQSLLATRMRTRDMTPIAEEMDKVGYFAIEAWGGATFDSCIRYLNEDPWERLRSIKEKLSRTPLQMLVRGQNLVGYKHYPDDIVTKFIEKSYENGVDNFRVFDALNDVRNMEQCIKVAKQQGAHVQGTLSYTNYRRTYESYSHYYYCSHWFIYCFFVIFSNKILCYTKKNRWDTKTLKTKKV